MSPKAKPEAKTSGKKDSKVEAKVVEKKSAASGKTAAPVKGGKSPAKSAEIQAAPAAGAVGPNGEPQVDQDELDEQEDAAAAAASSSGGNAAALAAASGSTEISASFKNFRHHPDMENFYRFIYDNDLRHEALDIIDVIMTDKQNRRITKGAKASAH